MVLKDEIMQAVSVCLIFNPAGAPCNNHLNFNSSLRTSKNRAILFAEAICEALIIILVSARVTWSPLEAHVFMIKKIAL